MKYQRLFKEDLYDFQDVDIDITEENYNEALKLRNKFSSYPNIGVATFLSNIILWRCIDEQELSFIRSLKEVRGGSFSVEPEKYFGASFSGSRKDAIEFGITWKKRDRLKGQLYIIGIKAEDKEFLHLDMVNRLKEQNLKYEVDSFKINSKLGDSGLGFSVADVRLKDIISMYALNSETKELSDLSDRIRG